MSPETAAPATVAVEFSLEEIRRLGRWGTFYALTERCDATDSRVAVKLAVAAHGCPG